MSLTPELDGFDDDMGYDGRDDTGSGSCHHGVGFDEDCELCDLEAEHDEAVALQWLERASVDPESAGT